MANLKRNSIKLITGYDEEKEELQYKRYWTAPFTPLRTMYDAIDLMEKIQSDEIQPREAIDLQLNFVANVVYNGQFSTEDLQDGLDVTEGVDELMDQILFIAQGQQGVETKKFLAKTN